MTTSDSPEGGRRSGAPGRAFPLIRHLSVRVTPWLARLPVTPNQITAASLVAGLAAAACLLPGERGWAVAAGLLLVVCYVLDNCDGEIARIKDLASAFGDKFDTFADWLVHTAFFAALGWGAARASGVEVWLWLGWTAAAGTTINYLLVLLAEARSPAPEPGAAPGDGPAMPRGAGQWAIYVFRELSRADFCFIVLLLALLDALWVLLPLGAVGAQVYWLLALVRSARRFHV